MTAPRGLSAEERAAWERVAASVTPLNPPRPGKVAARSSGAAVPPAALSATAQRAPERSLRQPLLAQRPPPSVAREDRGLARPRPDSSGLDSHWDRKFQAGRIEPDFTLDLHGHTLDSAHARLDDGLIQAKAMGARVVLLIAGKPRPVDAADRGSKRGAIRAKVLDWLAIGPHGADIAAIRKAHRRHGGEGALYLILKRRR